MLTKPPVHKLFVANIPWSVTSERLQEHFDGCGNIVECNVVIDRETDKSKGFGFVTFMTEQGMKSGLDLNGSDLEGRLLSVRVAESKGKKFEGPKRDKDGVPA